MPTLTFDELRQIKEVLEFAYLEATTLARHHQHCPPGAACHDAYQTTTQKAQAALDLVNRELNKE